MSLPKWRALAGAWLAPICLVVLAVLSFTMGKYAIAPNEIGRAFWAVITGSASGLPPAVETVIWEIRAPRVVAALLIGAALAAAGATYQGLFRNPLVSPDILGVTAGASLGAVVGIYFALPVLAIQALAFAGGLAAVALVYAIGSAVRTHDPVLALVLAGT